MISEVKIKKVLTSMLHAYEALIENPQEEIHKWKDYGCFNSCKLCLLFASIDDEGWLALCGDCPLSDGINLPRPTVHCCEQTLVDLLAAIKDYQKNYTEFCEGVWAIKWFKENPESMTAKQKQAIKKAAKNRYSWLIKQIGTHGYEYK